jgi:hypothetical protein
MELNAAREISMKRAQSSLIGSWKLMGFRCHGLVHSSAFTSLFRVSFAFFFITPSTTPRLEFLLSYAALYLLLFRGGGGHRRGAAGCLASSPALLCSVLPLS